MFFALDQNNNRVNAEDGEYNQCICPACGNPVIQKKGDYKRHHFAHKRRNESCPFEYNQDYINMSEWHKRMQEYFPEEKQEYIFTDKETGEKHIADVFIEETNTVLEFQYSAISRAEFLGRTFFHLNEGRRMAWLFYEGWKNDNEKGCSAKLENKSGRLKPITIQRVSEPYSKKCFKWRFIRNPVKEHLPVCQSNYSVCVCTDTEGDLFHRIVHLDTHDNTIIVSLHDITMSDNMDTDEFFYLENHWTNEKLWKGVIEQRPYSIRPVEDKNDVKNTNSLSGESDEYKRRYNEYEPVDIRIKKNLAKENAAISQGKCPKCGGRLVVRNGKNGSFYGCSNFPKCNYTHSC